MQLCILIANQRPRGDVDETYFIIYPLAQCNDGILVLSVLPAFYYRDERVDSKWVTT